MLEASDFTPFIRELYGRDPFPWQQGLVDRVLADGDWPDLIDVPTGLGKTSTLDIAVFVAAATAAQDRRRSTGPPPDPVRRRPPDRGRRSDHAR